MTPQERAEEIGRIKVEIKTLVSTSQLQLNTAQSLVQNLETQLKKLEGN